MPGVPDFAEFDHLLNRCRTKLGVFREINPLVLVGAMKKFQNVEKDAASICPVAGADHFVVRIGITAPLFSLALFSEPLEQFVAVNAAGAERLATGILGLANFVNIDP